MEDAFVRLPIQRFVVFVIATSCLISLSAVAADLKSPLAKIELTDGDCLVFLGELPELRDGKPIVRNSFVLGLVVMMCACGLALGFMPSSEDDGEQMYDEMGFPIDS